MPNPPPGGQHDDYGSPLAPVVSSAIAPNAEQHIPLFSNPKTSDVIPTQITYNSPTSSFEPAKSDNLPQQSYDSPQPVPNPAGQPPNDSAEPEYNAAVARPAYHSQPADASYNEVESDEYGMPLAPVIPLLSLEKGIIQPDDKSDSLEQKVPLAPVNNLKYASIANGETVEDSFEYWETPDGDSPLNPLAPALASFALPSPQPTLRELPRQNLLYNPISVADPTTPQPSPTAKTAITTSTSKPSYGTTVKEIVGESSTPPAASKQPSTTAAYSRVESTTSSSETLAPIVYSYSTPAPESENEETPKREATDYIPGSSVGPYIGAAPVFSQGPRVPDIWEMFNAEWGQRVRRRSG